MGKKTRIGTVEIFADTGLDEWQKIQDKIKSEIERKKVKPGQKFFMPVDFGTGRMIIKMEVEAVK